jgi:hypothetical protein
VQHPQDLERWRKMSPAERLRIALDLTDLAWQFLLRLPAEERERRLAIAREPWNPPPSTEPPR